MKFLIALLLMIFTVVPAAAKNLTLTEAHKLAAHARKKTTFPIVLNDDVLNHLNRFVGRSGGRKHMKLCLKRMADYRPLISKKLKKHNLPEELMAIPVIESSYQNIHSENKTGSGLWMLIKPTAKVYGLKVNAKTDERLHVSRSTDAALRLLKNNQKRFKDWHLTLLAYNAGEFRVKKAIKKTGTRDAWALIDQGHHGDKEYLAKLMAVMIIMKNPKVLR